MSEKFAKTIISIACIIAVIFGIMLTVIGGLTEGWYGVATVIGGLAVFVVLLFLYNRKYK